MSDVFAPAPAELGNDGELMVTFMMERYGISRDTAIGGLMTFLAGAGQPSTEIFTRFPSLATLYYQAIAKANEVGKKPDVTPAT